jgi:hypothetical protein
MEEVAVIGRRTLATLAASVLSVTPVSADARIDAYLAAVRALVASGPAQTADALPASGPQVRLRHGAARLVHGAISAALDQHAGEGLRLVIVAHGRPELSVTLRATADLPADAATLQIADIDRENATPEVLVGLIRPDRIRLIVATAKSDGPGWEIGPSVLELDGTASLARDVDGDGRSELVIPDPKAAALRLPDGLAPPLAVLTMRATAWFDSGAEPWAAPVHRARLAGIADNLAGGDDVRTMLVATLAVAARINRLDDLWDLARRLDLGGRAVREAVVTDLRDAGYIPAELSLDPRRPGDRSR